jgi:AraC-like DNA-binding protein
MWVRIAKAKQLLRKNTSITNVAFEVGFNSLENFSYAFRKMVGISPIQYKMSNISKPY